MTIATITVSRGIKGDKGDKGDTGAAAAVPSGTGFTHITSGVQDGAAKTVVDGDVAANAAIAGTKVAPDFGNQNIVTTGTAAAAGATLSGLGGGGNKVVKTDNAGALSGTLVTDALVDAAAAIAGTKVAPDFGSQNITTTGLLLAGAGFKGDGGPFKLPSVNVDVSGGPVTLNAAQQAFPVVTASGLLAGDQSVVLPNVADAFYIVENLTTTAGAPHNVIFKIAGGTGVTVAQNMTQIIRHNGTDYVPVTAAV